MPNILLNIDTKRSNNINQNTSVFIEAGVYNICDEIQCESPCSIRGVKLAFPFFCGAFTHINPNGFIQNCTIGRYCAIATGVKIGNGNHPTNWLSVNACQYIPNFHGYKTLFEDKIKTKPFTPYKHTIIGNDVWIGANVYIKDGVKIGDGAIIGANSVVTHDVDPYAIMAGTPAKLLRYRFTKDIIKELLEIKWWEYSIADFGDIDFNDIKKAIIQLKEKLPNLKKYTPPQIVDSTFLTETKKELIIPSKVKKHFLGIIKTVKYNGYKTKYFMGIKLYKKKLKGTQK